MAALILHLQLGSSWLPPVHTPYLPMSSQLVEMSNLSQSPPSPVLPVSGKHINTFSINQSAKPEARHLCDAALRLRHLVGLALPHSAMASSYDDYRALSPLNTIFLFICSTAFLTDASCTPEDFQEHASLPLITGLLPH